MMSVMQEAMELADSILIISLISIFMMINNSTEGPWLLLQFHKQKSIVQIGDFLVFENPLNKCDCLRGTLIA
jgi:hypothetical protein